MHSAKASLLPHKPWPYDTRYCGLTAEQVIEQFKSPLFPRHAFPQSLLGIKVETLHARSNMGDSVYKKAMGLLNDPRYHGDALQRG